MSEQKAQFYFFLILFAATLILSFLIFLPYLQLIALAATFAVIFYPLYVKILNRLDVRESLAVILTMIAVFLIVLIPLALFGFLILQEAQDLYFKIQTGQLPETLSPILKALQSLFGAVSPDFLLNTDFYLKEALSWTIKNLGGIFVNLAQWIFHFAIGLIAFFYFLKDGRKFITALITMSPLADSYDQEVFQKLEKAVVSVIRGALLIAVMQGILTGIGFWLFRVPNPALWAGVNTIMALIPAIGTSIISLVGIIYLLAIGKLALAILLLLWSLGVVGFIDNLLRPQLIGGKINIHPFLILIAVLGGLEFLGPTGVILGPVILSLLFALGEVYSGILKQST